MYCVSCIGIDRITTITCCLNPRITTINANLYLPEYPFFPPAIHMAINHFAKWLTAEAARTSCLPLNNIYIAKPKYSALYFIYLSLVIVISEIPSTSSRHSSVGFFVERNVRPGIPEL